MRGICESVRPLIVVVTVMAIESLVSGCATVEGGPARLYPVSDEVAQARGLLESTPAPNAYQGLVEQYYAVDSKSPTADSQRMYFRNEIIARRMYVIDVEYSDYEEKLTKERQEFGFITATTAQGLSTAGALASPVQTAKLLSGLSAAVGATRGLYDSELVLAKTVQIVEAQMRAQRDTVAKGLLQRRTESSITYPLSAALSDLESYYLAGTFNSGLIKAAGDAGVSADKAAADKQIVVTYGFDASTEALANCLKKPGAGDKLAALVNPKSHVAVGRLVVDTSPDATSARATLMSKANAAGICP